MADEKFRAEQANGHWVVVHVASGQIVATGLSEQGARQVAAGMRESKPTDL